MNVLKYVAVGFSLIFRRIIAKRISSEIFSLELNVNCDVMVFDCFCFEFLGLRFNTIQNSGDEYNSKSLHEVFKSTITVICAQVNSQFDTYSFPIYF